MLTLSSARCARIAARITSLDTRIAALEDSLETAATKDIEEYSFNSGDGSQRAVHRKIEQMEKTLDVLYRRREYLANILRGRGIVQMVAHRR